MVGDIQPPPAIYDHEFSGRLLEFTYPASLIPLECHDQHVYSCSQMVGDDVCILVMPYVGPGGVAPRTYALLRRHEIAHCNGWRHR